MSTGEHEVSPGAQVSTAAPPAVVATKKREESILDNILGLLSSVRFGVTMLGILLICCMIGMLIVQVNVVEADAFPKYYRQITPAQRTVFGFLQFFDIYRSWYFTLLLAITGLNIILASIDRFPAAWQYIVKPKLTASPKFINAQMFTAEAHDGHKPQTAAEKIRDAWKKRGFRPRVTEENNRITVFGQRSAWNRLGAYVVHVALLTIFIGGFMTSRYGMGGSMEIQPGKTGNTFTALDFGVDGPVSRKVSLPAGMEIECKDLQQKLIRPEGGLDAQNTIDWLSYITIKDGSVRKDMLVHLNNVGDYRGYRFFQSQFQPLGHAREITIKFTPVSGGEPRLITIPRDGSGDVEGIGHIAYADFFADFGLGPKGPINQSPDYNNPVAELEITTPDGSNRRAYAFQNQQQAEDLEKTIVKNLGQVEADKATTIGGYKVSLVTFEKVSSGHTLTIQYDPGRTPVYAGFSLLVLALCGVFFFSHQRVWAVVEPDEKGSKVLFGGNTNRNRPAFEGRFNSLVQSATEGGTNQ